MFACLFLLGMNRCNGRIKSFLCPYKVKKNCKARSITSSFYEPYNNFRELLSLGIYDQTAIAQFPEVHKIFVILLILYGNIGYVNIIFLCSSTKEKNIVQ